jgi:4-amino-4-deoxy-L-arabinose transferase-like glycosyltransferase
MAESTVSRASERWLFWLIWAALIAALFFRLGDAALFEPDEGRNAEKAREVLLLGDWVTPHENFQAVLDKPIFLYWLIAASFKFFGLSEWAARLPPALAAFACLVLVYRFVLARWGRWEAYWSVLILLTSAEFFILARTVIFDMPLTFFLTLALWAFYEAAHSERANQRRVWCLALYSALGIATLIKGLIGVILPGMVIFFYLLLSNRWAVLRRIYLIPGALLFFAIVSPWYLAADARNDGYLHYYLWDEHFGRFTRDDFDRGEPWFYFILVALVGAFPWTLLLPLVIKEAWKTRLDDKTLYLILWIALPLLFFSASKSKLPHYILPIFPALAILMATTLVRCYRASAARLRLALSFTWWLQSATGLYLAVGTFLPMVLARQIRDAVESKAPVVWIFAAMSIVVLVYLLARKPVAGPPNQRGLFLVQGLGLGIFLFFFVEIATAVSPARSARDIAAKALQNVTPATQVIFYNTYLSGMAFYLRTERPIWFVTKSNKKRTFLGNYHALNHRADPVTLGGQAILDFDEFRNRWRNVSQPLLVIVKEKNLSRLQKNVGETLRRLAAVDEYLLVGRP